ncbi:MAG: hypothetical protein HF981_19560 [Desulfobacteraceae bacterium]|nr:hypothetical protein [Desulfobacteraceae bacterium]MBC2752599.1 hypothetical protein [Desulfobacteraceae bacterium]
MCDFDSEDFLLGYLIGSDREDEIPEEPEPYDPFYEPAPGEDEDGSFSPPANYVALSIA